MTMTERAHAKAAEMCEWWRRRWAELDNGGCGTHDKWWHGAWSQYQIWGRMTTRLAQRMARQHS